jgi:ankyrin repeat protein
MNVYDQTPLLRTAMNGHEAVVKLLLGKGVDPDHSDEFNQTPLC